jgi:hypothetical protein
VWADMRVRMDAGSRRDKGGWINRHKLV